jgi:IS1 family transposase
MNRLSQAKQAQILRALTEGASVRSTARMAQVSKNTVLKLLVDVGELCTVYQYYKLRNLPTTRVEADELWAFVGAKQRNAKRGGDGDIWTYVALDADSKLAVTWLVGARTIENTKDFVKDLSERIANRVQLTTDGLYHYPTAVEAAFGWQGADYAQIIKVFSSKHGPGGRYSPPECIGVERKTVMGQPDAKHISTSFVERQNLNMRMSNRRFTRLTNAFSRKVLNHEAAVALHFMVYNFCKAHGTLTKRAKGVHTSPAMASGLADHVWSVEEILGLMDPQKLLQ